MSDLDAARRELVVTLRDHDDENWRYHGEFAQAARDLLAAVWLPIYHALLPIAEWMNRLLALILSAAGGGKKR